MITYIFIANFYLVNAFRISVLAVELRAWIINLLSFFPQPSKMKTNSFVDVTNFDLGFP